VLRRIGNKTSLVANRGSPTKSRVTRSQRDEEHMFSVLSLEASERGIREAKPDDEWDPLGRFGIGPKRAPADPHASEVSELVYSGWTFGLEDGYPIPNDGEDIGMRTRTPALSVNEPSSPLNSRDYELQTHGWRSDGPDNHLSPDMPDEPVADTSLDELDLLRSSPVASIQALFDLTTV
jgi:hypothetical protein